ncbi:MAG TPA: CDP-alcohol phosphatidyltransferase family protein [Chthoniobacterales bacterium]|jgi:CDP-L-myo-inositol myo-inositolphosphotransferase
MSKPQDGFVSRFFNRPISRSITRFLIKFPVHPDVWTLSIFVLPIVSCLFLLRGSYAGIVIGAALYQLYSILDGCDGEIARAKNLESKFGEFLDSFCDFLASLLFVIALGFGLNRSSEGIVCALLIAANELVLAASRSPTSIGSPELYTRHRRMVEHSGLIHLGDRFVWWIMQVTKRDVAILFFFLLALLGRADWILHLWLVVASVSLILSGVAAIRAGARKLSAPRV